MYTYSISVFLVYSGDLNFHPYLGMSVHNIVRVGQQYPDIYIGHVAAAELFMCQNVEGVHLLRVVPTELPNA